ncbi:hypothetical protein FEM48_Zijuj10G0088300 [Ziziphus jujuba var. spinosa]|uniref:Uncharacterized protein n=1 Tax=Ziziphus jujuba var. spinosa TaxID=714518 RepID=A0A978UMF0_ZIZJJ|nr:hypothetical protein FEM48_Zijuj10G0088300 [Ziziphus jujuba var. spinosa]
MESPASNSPRMRLDHLRKEGSGETHSRVFELEPCDHDNWSNPRFGSMNALEILRETVRILRYNSSGFMAIAALLICPVSAVLLSNVLVDLSLVKRLTIRLLLVSKSSGLPLRPFIKQSCQKFAEMAISSATCFPLFITLSLLSKAAIVYTVDCSYSRKKFEHQIFSVVFANAIIICNIAIVISYWRMSQDRGIVKVWCFNQRPDPCGPSMYWDRPLEWRLWRDCLSIEYSTMESSDGEECQSILESVVVSPQAMDVQ